MLLALVLLAGCSAQPDSAARTDAAPTAPTDMARANTTAAPMPESTIAAVPDPSVEPGAVVSDAKAPSAPAAPGRTGGPIAAPAISSAYRIEIPRLGINLPVAEGDVPRDIERAETPEHYAFHLPGTSLFERGNTYIYAHARPGMFLSLWKVRIGDLVIVRTPLGDREYIVAEIHPSVPPLQVSWAGPTEDTRLTLQTSTGPHGDDPRFVVVARPR